MLADKMGKFSTKLVKILAYQKNDYEAKFAADAENEAAQKEKDDAKAGADKKKKKKADDDAAAAKAAEENAD